VSGVRTDGIFTRKEHPETIKRGFGKIAMMTELFEEELGVMTRMK